MAAMKADSSRQNLLSVAEDTSPQAARPKESSMASAVSSEDGPSSSFTAIDRYFDVSARGSTWQTEVRSGCISWMTMSYILVVNPVILCNSDPLNPIPVEPIMTATALSAAVGSLIVGLWGDAPMGLMPGMGLNAYFAFGICRAFHVSFEQALSCCFVSGALLLLLTALGVCNWLVDKVLSDHLKTAITVAVGIFQALIGFQVMGLVVSSPDTLITLGDVSPSNTHLYLALAGFLLISAMLVRRLQGVLLVGIWAMSICAWTSGMFPPPTGIFEFPRFDTAFRVDFSAWAPGSPKLPCMIVGSLVLPFVALFDLAGVQYGLMGIAGLLKNGTVPRSTSILTSAAVGTMVGALLGTSPVVIATESSAGIVAGARTGLAAVTISALFFVSAFLAPLLGSIPHVATAVPLVLIGAFMMAPCRGIDWDDLRAAIPSFLTIMFVPFTYSIHNGIIAGILMDFFLGLTAAKDEVKAGAFSPGGASRSSRQPLFGDKRQQLMSPAIMEKLSTPHASVASFRKDVDKALLSKAEKARQLMVELRFAMATSGPPSHGQAMDESQRRVQRLTEGDGAASDEALLKALEAYLGGQPTAIGID